MSTHLLPAVVFDFGGVLISPIGDKVAALAARHDTTMEQLLRVLLGPSESGNHPWHRCERGELAVADIQQHLGPWAAAAGVVLDGDEIATLLAPTYQVLHQVLDRVDELRAAGYATALLTNTFAEFHEQMDRDIDFSRFDVVIESFAVRSRKPEPAIYDAVADALGVEHSDIVYLDDFEHNLRPAVALGWTVVHVTSPELTLAELDRLAPTTTRSSG